MIRLLQGQIHSRDERTIILFINGVGYHVAVSSAFSAEENEEITLFIHTHVREDAITLYGFRTKNELNFFEILMSVNGIGPKMGMEILNSPAEKVQNAILQGNLAYLTSISGVGKKIAERMILELKNKLDPINLTSQNQNSPHLATTEPANEEAIAALENLGYKRNHVTRILAEANETAKSAEDLIKFFLKKV
ncbi:MAG: Holliday junction branch migration protein RuvA [Candidatus Gracilibacteria bacterium]|jgi:Holliday junction DNA helicase RuvA